LPKYNLNVRKSLLKLALCAILTMGWGATPAFAQNAAPAVPLPGGDFVQAVSSFDAFEQRAGKIGGIMGNSLEVRRFSRLMIDDHAKSAAGLIDSASKAGVAAPTADLSPSQAAAVKELYAVASKDFDHTYMTNEVDSHNRALEAAQAYAAAGDNAAIKQVAAALIPAIQRHLDQAKVILGHVR
jgi:putative membrane protein